MKGLTNAIKFRRYGATFVFLAISLGHSPIWAMADDIAIHVLCPALTEDARAELAARAQVDLSARAARGGELYVRCDGLRADVRWRPRTMAWIERSVPAAATPAALVDALLAAVAELAQKPSADRPAPIDQPTGAAPAEEVAVESETEASAPKRAAPVTRQVAMEKERSAKAETLSPALPTPLALGLSLGGQAFFFSTRGTGAAGPRLGVFLAMPPRFEASLLAEYGLGFGDGAPFTSHMPGLTALVAARFGLGRVLSWN